jgi:hypothetical protein
LSGEKTNVTKTISVLVVRILADVLVLLLLIDASRDESDELLDEDDICDGDVCSTIVKKHVSTLRTKTEMDFETLVFSPLNHLTRLITRENFITIGTSHHIIMLPILRPRWHPALLRNLGPRRSFVSSCFVFGPCKLAVLISFVVLH